MREDEMGGAGKVLFGRYEMGRVLGRGTFSKVYHGKHVGSGEAVAVKVIDKAHIRREGLAEQLVREISVMRLVRHPHVVRIREVMATKARVFVVMEYVRGGDLFWEVAKGKVKEDVARRYFRQLLSAVEFCHSRGISHRDLKLENVLLDDKGDIKVSDFGLSALPEQVRTDGLLHTQCGTPAYVAPEVLRRKGYDGGKADLWSCGVLLYVLLAGFLPFKEENLMKMYAKVFKAEYKFPAWFSAGARNLLSRLLVANPEKRITVPEILRHPWLKKELPLQPSSPPEPDREEEAPPEKGVPGPAFYNAFQLISTMSSGFDLSGMFETTRKVGTVFTSKNSTAEVMEMLEKVGRGIGFQVRRAKEYKVAFRSGNGRLAVTAELFELTPGVQLVEFTRSAGDPIEYTKFCEEDVRPGLKEIVWTWQGDFT